MLTFSTRQLRNYRRGLAQCRAHADASSAVQMVQMCCDLAKLGDHRGLLDLVPDSEVEKALRLKQQLR
jgi:hypothetical protein